MRILVDGKQVTAVLDGVFDTDADENGAAAFRGLGEWRGAVRRYREGAIDVDVAGKGRKAICVLEHEPVTVDLVQEDRWWMALRLVRESAGIEVFEGDWQVREGTGLVELGLPFSSWLEAGDRVFRLGPAAFQEEQLPGPSITMAVGESDIDLPETPELIAALAGSACEESIVARGGLDCLLVFTFRGRTLYMFEVRGALPCHVQDVFRNFAAFTRAEALAFTRIAEKNVNGTMRTAVVTVAEIGGHRYERVQPFEQRPAGDRARSRPSARRYPTRPPNTCGSALSLAMTCRQT